MLAHQEEGSGDTYLAAPSLEPASLVVCVDDMMHHL